MSENRSGRGSPVRSGSGARAKQHGRRRSLTMIVLSILMVAAISLMVIKRVAGGNSEELATGVVGSETATNAEQVRLPLDNALQLEADFKYLQDQIDGEVGLVVKAIGDFDGDVVLGSWTSGPAWSTIKVPLSIAALRGEAEPRVTSDMVAAITQSDNIAADALWRGLGDPPEAARKVEAILRESGDNTVVQDQRVRPDRPELSSFGQTQWPLAEQARFLASAACGKGNDPIFALMGEVAGDQTWGIGQLDGARYKGGWGPSVSGAYLVRQIGVLQTPPGQTVVAVAVQPASGSFEDGTKALSRVAEWISDHEALLPSGNCSNVVRESNQTRHS